MERYHVLHNGLIKWEHDGKQYCLHTQIDDAPVNPLDDEDLVSIACWRRHNDLGNVDTKDVDPSSYWHNLVRENINGQDVVAAARADSLSSVSVKKSGDGLNEIHWKENGGVTTIEHNVPDDELVEAILYNVAIADCQKLLQDVVFSLPLYAYEHSGISISCSNTYPYNDQFDGGQTGWAFMTKKTAQDNWPCDDSNWKEKAESVIRSMIETYDQYLTGDVWWFSRLEKTEPDGEWEEQDSCGGFFGSDIFTSGMLDHVENGLADALQAETYEEGTAKKVVSVHYDYDC